MCFTKSHFLAQRTETYDGTSSCTAGLACHLVRSFVHTLPLLWQDISFTTKVVHKIFILLKMCILLEGLSSFSASDTHSPKPLFVYYDTVAICCCRGILLCYSLTWYIDGQYIPLSCHQKYSKLSNNEKINKKYSNFKYNLHSK